MERRAIAIHGVVQGVGFRPFIHGLASRLHLGGFVRNHSGSVLIEVEGETEPLEQFLDAVRHRPPPLARIETIDCRPQTPRGEMSFEIEPSEDGAAAICICPDIATCDDCLRELFDPTDRRWRYPFINCTNCGPRLTIIRGAPYDRQRTTMASFEMCDACRREYQDPRDRRFHAQPIACPVCGPRVILLDDRDERIDCVDPISATADALRAGRIVAIKGLGGFHLACDATNESAVRELRRRKHREEKPLAVMARDHATAATLGSIAPADRDLLISPARPIVLLRKQEQSPLADSVAPDNPFIGVMLPYTPLHHLLFASLDTHHSSLVMTSGNRSDEPIAYEDADAVARLAGIADLFLTHNRPIHVRCDDSVTQSAGNHGSPIRRSRGYAPLPLTLPIECPQPILAVGGQLKATFALARDRHAILSHHLGDLDHFQALRAFERDIELYQRLFELEPRVIAHDLHPDYASTRYAMRQRDERGTRLLSVQHHHAHMASCMAEHGLNEPVIGVSFDGTGYGPDGAIWGGEFLVGDYASFRRAAHLRYVAMPGGEKAIHEPWRMALAHLLDAGADVSPLQKRIAPTTLRAAVRMLERNFNAPKTSSAGRLFDAIASLAGVRDIVRYEAQAAMQLEWLAAGVRPDGVYPFELVDGPTITIDTRPLIRAAAGDSDPARIARRFHSTLVAMICSVCVKLAAETKLNHVVLSGGVFLNQLLSDETCAALSARGLIVHRHRHVPPNDGGLSLGQIAVAARQLTLGPKE